jgi:hypothetical protein
MTHSIMQISFQLSQNIKLPVTETFAFLSDPENISKWNYYVESVVKVSGDGTAGSVYKQKRKHDSLCFKIIRISAYKIEIELLLPAPLQRYSFTCTAVSPAETNVVYDWSVDLENYKALKYIPNGKFKNFLLSFASRHVHNIIKPAVEQNFGKLKTLLEEGEVILQDGRRIMMNDEC